MSSREPARRYFSGEVINDLRASFTNFANRALICCINCKHWQGQNETCKLNGRRPPANIIALGCECFEDCDIPF